MFSTYNSSTWKVTTLDFRFIVTFSKSSLKSRWSSKKVLSVHFKSSCRSWGILRNNRTWTQCPGKLFEKRNSPLHFVRFSETNLPYRIFSHKRGIWDAHISHNPNECSVEHATFVHVLFEHWRFTWLGQFWSPLLVPDKFSISSRIRFPSLSEFKLNNSLHFPRTCPSIDAYLSQFLVWIFHISIGITFSAWLEIVACQSNRSW